MRADPHPDLGTFLRRHRERLRLEDVGLPARSGERRRTPGLRREEVASLCGVSTTWYSWIEQGREVSASAAALGRLADVFRLSKAERAYLFELGRRQDPRPEPPAAIVTPPGVAAVIAAVGVPAYGLDRLWRACGWNAAAAHLFAGWLGGPEPCLLRYVFLDPAARRFITDWDARARRLVAEFRADTGHAGGDAAVGALLAGLRRDSPVFETLWGAHDILGREGGLRLFDHPQDGRLCYEQVTLQLSGDDQFKIVMLFPREVA